MKALRIVGVVLLGVIVVAISLPKDARGPKKKGPTVYVEVLALGELSKDVSATGVLEPKESIWISAEVLGNVAEVLVKEGEQVSRGQLLMRIDRGKLQEDIDRLDAQRRLDSITIEGAELRLRKAEGDLARTTDLHTKGILSDADLDSADLAWQQARVDVSAAVERQLQTAASLRALRSDLEKTNIEAPLAGTVLQVQRRVGEGVAPGMGGSAGTSLIKIGDLSSILVVVAIEEADVSLVAVGQKAHVEVDAQADERFEAVVEEVAIEGGAGGRGVVVFDTRLRLLEPSPQLRVGMTARADVHVGREEDVLVVPQSAMRDEEGEEIAFVEEDGVVSLRTLSTGTSNATHVVVTAGLEPGDRVVTGPHRALKDLEDGADVRAEVEGDDDDSAD